MNFSFIVTIVCIAVSSLSIVWFIFVIKEYNNCFRENEEIKAELMKKNNLLLNKDSELQTLSVEQGGFKKKLEGFDAERKKYDSCFRENEEIKAELAKRNALILTKDKEMQALNIEQDKLRKELEGFSAERKKYEADAAVLKTVGSDITFLERTIEEQKRVSHDMKQRLEEGKIKIELLNQKTKENVELLAQFAKTKEFDEFRKSIHLDEIVRKYEDEVKNLKLKNMELEKKCEQ